MLLYQQITEELENGILTGTFPPGSKLPSARAFAVQYHVNPNTAQRAFCEMKRTGLLISPRGKGTFVTNDFDLICRTRQKRRNDLVSSFFAQMEMLGYSREQAIRLLQEQGRDHSG
ncbi:MAG: GntR family transcriptional regulator [Eubacteriales bacterium]|nr:GntR family transcriptional regulator [Eubacteriales bacterium]